MHKSKLRKLLLISLLLLVFNVAEKRLFGFETAFGHVKTIFGSFANSFQSSDTALFYVIAAIVFLWLATAVLLLCEGRAVFVATGFIGVILASEVHQLSFLILGKGYYPGMVTGLLFCAVGVFVLRESYRGFRAVKKLEDPNC